MKNTNAFYTCPYCKTEYENPVDLAHCILSCEEKERMEVEAKKAKELELAKEARTREIREKEDELCKLINAYLKDYGSYSATRSESGYPSIWHWFY